MTYVICDPCLGTKDTACVDACPVDCIHPRMDESGFEDEPQLYIDPGECIDCGACAPECPAQAIYAEDEVPAQWRYAVESNARWYGGLACRRNP